MFERWTDRSRRIVVLAREEARLMNHERIGTEHFLLGMIAEGECVAAQALKALGVPGLVAMRQQVAEIGPAGNAAATAGHIPFTPRAKKVTELALREALQMGVSYIGTEHVLLAIEREGQGIAMKALEALGIEHGAVRAKVLELLRGWEKPAGDSLPPMADDRENKMRYFAEDGLTRYEEADKLRRRLENTWEPVQYSEQREKLSQIAQLNATLSVAAFLAAAELRAAGLTDVTPEDGTDDT